MCLGSEAQQSIFFPVMNGVCNQEGHAPQLPCCLCPFMRAWSLTTQESDNDKAGFSYLASPRQGRVPGV